MSLNKTRALKLGLMAFAVFCNLSCSVNILSNFANKNTNESLYEDAQNDLNNANYQAALTDIGNMTGTYATSTSVLELKASAYAGLCGMVFIPTVQAIGSIGTTRIFPFLLKAFDFGQSANIDNCLMAQTILLSIGSPTQLSTNDNMFLALVAFAKIGNILSFYADPTQTGAPATNYDPCAVGPVTRPASPGGAITDSDAREIGTGISFAVASLTALAGQVNLGSGQLSSISTVCSALPAGYNFCAVTDPSAFTALEVKGIRSLLNESSVIGLGSNCSGDVTTCYCP